MSKLRSNVIYQAIYHVLAVCIPLVTSPYLSRVLGAEGLGIYSYNYSIVSYFMLFALLGVSTYGLRTISQSKGKAEVSRNFFGIYAFQLISSGLALAVYVAFVALLIADPVSRTVCFVQILYLVGECLSINWLFFGLEKHKNIVLRNIIIKFLTVISIFLFVKEKGDVVAYIFILAFSHLLSNLIIWVYLKGCIVKAKIGWQDVRKHIKPNLILFIPALAASVYHIMDKTMLGIFSDSTNSGYYYNADKLLNIPLVVVTGCSVVFLSRACALAKQADTYQLKKTQDESIYFGMCLICAVAFGICAVAEEFVPFFFGAGYEPCIDLVKYFAVIVIVKTVSTHTRSVFLIPENNDTSYAKAITIGGLTNLVTNYVLIALWNLGALGATLGTLIAEVMVAVLQILFIRDKDSKRSCVGGILRSAAYLVLGGAMLFVLELIPMASLNMHMRLGLKVLVGAGVYLGGCAIVWKLWPELMPDMIKETLVSVEKKLALRS